MRKPNLKSLDHNANEYADELRKLADRIQSGECMHSVIWYISVESAGQTADLGTAAFMSPNGSLMLALSGGGLHRMLGFELELLNSEWMRTRNEIPGD